MQVHEVMTTEIITVSPETPFSRIWEVIFKKGIHGLPVVDKDNKILGIIAEEDLLLKLYSSYRLHPLYEKYLSGFVSGKNFEEMEKKLEKLTQLQAKDIMNRKVYLTYPEKPMLRALSKMIVRRVRQLPVITKKKEVIGMITKGDIFDCLFKKYLKFSKFKS
ncbi:CBS domain-containing protein [Candidatus Microgenomates bacterium]|nr:CBS domain-containing protein [Candidatus Microgenomates bacterium]